MIETLTQVTFIHPWILAGLIFLPALWFLLQVTPPGPKRILFPAARLFKDIQPIETTASKTPWWILLLRLLIAALVLIALAKPVINPSAALPGNGAVRIVMDNGWESAQTWRLQTQKAKEIFKQAGREKRSIYILTTAPAAGDKRPQQFGPLSQGDAEATLKGLAPRPWPSSYTQTDELIKTEKPQDTALSFWLSSGAGNTAILPLIKTLQAQGGLELYKPDNADLPVLLRPSDKFSSTLEVMIKTHTDLPAGVPLTVEARSDKGDILITQNINTNGSDKDIRVPLDLPTSMQNKMTQISIAGRNGAGTTMILDNRYQKRSVGIVLPPGKEETAPLMEQSYYIRRALAPYADMQTGTLNELLQERPSVIILPDIGAMPPSELNALEDWVKQGGLLLRFAGETMTEGQQFLTPVPLRRGGRALDGALTWDKPVPLAKFPEHSPLYGLQADPDITIKRQILAEPVADLDKKSWATLEDGTPLITAENLDKGLLVLVHTTATPEWSNLALSGVFVNMLRRIVSLSSFDKAHTAASGFLHPVVTLDGFGARQKPDVTVAPIPAAKIEVTKVSSKTPPGLYGNTSQQHALNIGTHIERVGALPNLPLSVRVHSYTKDLELDGMPYILLLALGLFLLDWLIMIIMNTGLLSSHISAAPKRFAKAALILLCSTAMAITLLSVPAHAQTAQDKDVTYASNIHLAYIKSGSLLVDQTAENGLTALSQILTRRTSVEPGRVVGINPETDEMAFFPFIYWPVTQESSSLSSEALRKIQYYLDHGGTILFDTRDKVSQASGQNGGGRNAAKLKSLISGLNIPPLQPMPEDHVLTKSFYLLKTFPGRYRDGTIWVEEKSSNGRDGVTSVIIGSHDWAYEWAQNDINNVHGGKTRKQELSYRFGVNLMMYALTGNYKADQVHVPHILERLGQ